MYPLNMQLVAPAIGFAVANDAAEHQALTAAGYGPAPVEPTKYRAALMAQAEAKAIEVDGRWSDARLAKEVAKA